MLLTGLRMGLILAFLSILGTETIASFAGLGHRIVELGENLDTSKMFAYIALVMVIAFLLNAAASFAEARGRRGSRVKAKLPSSGFAGRLQGIGIVAVALLAWELGARLFGDPLFVSPPSRVVPALLQLAHNKEIIAAVGLTCWELVAAFGLSVVIGLVG